MRAARASAMVRNLAALGLVVLLIALAPRLAASIHEQRPAGDTQQRLYYPDGPFLRHASLGFHAPVADYVWLQAVQYYGGYRRGEHDLRYFEGLVEAVVTLDPRFAEAYHFAALVLSMEHGDHRGAIDMLKRGILANPDHWRLPFTVGFIHYVFLREWGVATHWFEAAARLPGATDFCRRFAAFSAKRAGDWEGSIILWDHLARTTESAEMRELATRMIDQLQESLRDSTSEDDDGPFTPPEAQRGGREL
jgi:hypothetical protein